MKIKAKLRKIGNSQGIYIPKNVITCYNIGDVIEVEVITLKGKDIKKVITLAPKKVITSVKKDSNVITSGYKDTIHTTPYIKPKFNTKWCDKHNTYKGTCQCK